MPPRLKQFIPSKVCLACDGCCRFHDGKSVWRPTIAESEKSTAAHPGKPEKVFAPPVVDADNRLQAIPYQGTFICHFLNPTHNICGIYPGRPLECQLYPFLLMNKNGNPVIAVHLACPYVQEKRNTSEFAAYVEYLKDFFKQKATVRFLQKYPWAGQTYAGCEPEIEELFALSGVLGK